MYRVTCRSLSGEIRQTDEFRLKEAAERWANAINKVGYWTATIETVDDDGNAIVCKDTDATYKEDKISESE